MIHKDVVAQVRLFSHLEVQEILWIVNKLRTRVFMPGDYICEKGESIYEMGFIVEGVVEEVFERQAGKQPPRAPRKDAETPGDDRLNTQARQNTLNNSLNNQSHNQMLNQSHNRNDQSAAEDD